MYGEYSIANSSWSAFTFMSVSFLVEVVVSSAALQATQVMLVQPRAENVALMVRPCHEEVVA
jgi:hypothetical protein